MHLNKKKTYSRSSISQFSMSMRIKCVVWSGDRWWGIMMLAAKNFSRSGINRNCRYTLECSEKRWFYLQYHKDECFKYIEITKTCSLSGVSLFADISVAVNISFFSNIFATITPLPFFFHTSIPNFHSLGAQFPTEHFFFLISFLSFLSFILPLFLSFYFFFGTEHKLERALLRFAPIFHPQLQLFHNYGWR